MSKAIVPATPTRRAFLQQGALAGIAAGVLSQNEALALTLPVPTQFNDNPLAVVERLNRSEFTPHLSDHFETVDDDGQPAIMLLMEINDSAATEKQWAKARLTEAELELRREASFALIFRGPREQPMSSRSYTMTHPKLGELEIFLTPVERVVEKANWRNYEAVFNQLAE